MTATVASVITCLTMIVLSKQIDFCGKSTRIKRHINNDSSAHAIAQLVLNDAPHFHDVFPQIIADSGSYVSLKCSASGSPKPRIVWKIDGIPLDNPVYRIGDYITPNGRVVSYNNITSINVENAGIFSCEAINEIGNVFHEAKVDVRGAPFIRTIPDVKAIEGQRLFLRCPAVGYPITEITWLKGSNRLPLNRRHETLSNGTLIINNVQRSADDGSYTCRASSGESAASETFRIHVMTAPMIDPFSFPKNIQEGMRARLVCTVIKGDPPFLIQWKKDNKPIDPLSLDIRTDEFSSDLTFPRVSTVHNGNYSCDVTNDAATTTHSTVLVVDVPPQWKIEPKDSAVIAGQSIRIDCLAYGVPPVVVTWEKSHYDSPQLYSPISSGSHYEIYFNGSLFIKNTDANDSGYYHCSAHNSIGTTLSKVIFLTIHVPPVFETKFRSKSVRLGESATLKCESIGDNPMSIAWSVDKKPLNATDDRFETNEHSDTNRMISIIKIHSSNRRDSALYECLVTNKYGRDETSIRLIVQEHPEAPNDVRVVDQKSRSAKLTWSTPFNGNSPITKYWINCRIKERHPSQFTTTYDVNVSVEGIESSALIHGLRPWAHYQCIVRAQNDIGISESSNVVIASTNEEVPGAPPLDIRAESIDSHSVRVYWKAPERELWNGDLKGYYIGYKMTASNDQFLYKTLDASSDDHVILSSLRPFTEYTILVQAYNSMGAGPRSDEISVVTMEDVPSQSPDSVRCQPLSSQSLKISWTPPPPFAIHGILQGYRVVYRPIGLIAQSKDRITATNEVRLVNLEKFTNYSVEVTAFTKRGNGIPSKAVHCATHEDVPSPPEDIKVIIASHDSVIVSWLKPIDSNGILLKYTIHWRELNRTKSTIMIVARRNVPLQYKLIGLRKDTPYEFWMTVSTATGDSIPTKVVSQILTDVIRPKIVNIGHTLRLKSQSFLSLECTCPVPVQRVWRKNRSDILNAESDGSLLIQQLYDDETNFTCSVDNEFGSDEITYKLIREDDHWRKSIVVKILATNFNSAQIQFQTNLSAGFEVYYRPIEAPDWTTKRLTTENGLTIDELECGSSYQMYLVHVETGERSDVINFRTQGLNPIAPKKDDVIQIHNASSVVIFPSLWQQYSGCKLSKITVEYRSSVHMNWIRLKSADLNQPVILNTIQALYTIRMTAQTTGGYTTMAEYDVEISGESPANRAEIDTTTLVSITSSCVVLIAGCVAVACLVVYKKKTGQRHARTPAIREESQVKVVKKPSLVILRGSVDSGRGHSFQSSPVKGKLPQVQLSIIRHLKTPEPDIYNEEITPYATFRLTDCDDRKIHEEEEFKTFSVRIGEPAYIIKSSMDCAPTTSRCTKSDYQCVHSITSGSSNQDELIRAYEYGRKRPDDDIFDEDDDEFVVSEDETPTDPGIREFTKSPPKPNEMRIGEVTTRQFYDPRRRQITCSIPEMTEQSTTSSEESCSTPVNQHFNAIPRERSKKPIWKRAAAAKALQNKQGLSSDDDDERLTRRTKFTYVKGGDSGKGKFQMR